MGLLQYSSGITLAWCSVQVESHVISTGKNAEDVFGGLFTRWEMDIQS
jgi:hypothetical protein